MSKTSTDQEEKKRPEEELTAGEATAITASLSPPVSLILSAVFILSIGQINSPLSMLEIINLIVVDLFDTITGSLD